MKTFVVNLFAGSGAGKSTCAARLFAMLKENGVEAEMAPEYVKPMVWEDRKKIFQCQQYIFGKQLFKLVQVEGNVEVIVTDAPILFPAIYSEDQYNPYFKPSVLAEFNRFNNINFFLERKVSFNPKGRNEKTLEEAVVNDAKIVGFLQGNQIPFVTAPGSIGGCGMMFEEIMARLGRCHL